MKELALHILDIVQNSIQAEANRIHIQIEEDTQKDLLKITISDNGKGMDQAFLKRVTDPFTTTRTTRRVGLGLPLMKQAAVECNGNLAIESGPETGTTVSIWFQHSHIDRAPLGNMADTIAAVLMNGDHFDLKYQHWVNQKCITFDTMEIRQVLEDVPINHPDVVEWVRQSMQEKIEQLYNQI